MHYYGRLDRTWKIAARWAAIAYAFPGIAVYSVIRAVCPRKQITERQTTANKQQTEELR